MVTVPVPVEAVRASPREDDMTVQDTPGPYLDGFERILADAATTGRRLTRDELQSRRDLGAQAAEAGHGWRTLVRAHLTAAREGWPRGAAPDSVLTVIEQAVDAFGDGYERAQRLVVRKEEAARREFIDDLLHGRGDPGRLAAHSERFGLRLSRAHAVAVAEGPEKYDETDAVPRQVASELFARFENRRILVTTKDGRMVCIAPGDQDDVLTYFAEHAHAVTGQAQVAIGRPGPARSASDTVTRKPSTPWTLPSAWASTSRCCAPPTCWSFPCWPGTGRHW